MGIARSEVFFFFGGGGRLAKKKYFGHPLTVWKAKQKENPCCLGLKAWFLGAIDGRELPISETQRFT